MEKRRFAPLIRVSSEQQKKKGESLRTQRQQIEEAVKFLGGEIPANCWQYCGQESATPGQERKLLEKLLSDSSKGLFDCVIVADPSRWSRDNVKNEQGLEILLENHVLFFVQTTSYDLNDPQARLYLAMNAIMNQFQARIQAKKSKDNRQHRTQRGIPAIGNLPHGRTFDREKNQWGFDPEKKKNIIWAATQFLKGRSMYDIAKTLEVNTSNLWKVLKFQSGTTWETKFGVMEVPPLLPQDMIDAIHRKIESNKTTTHGPLRKNAYLLSHLIFCEECGMTMVGRPHPRDGYLVYQHQKERVIKRTCPNMRRWAVRASDIEQAVMTHLYSIFGDPEAIERSLRRAIPNIKEMERLRSQKDDFLKRLETLSKESDRIVDAIAKGTIPQDKAKARMDSVIDQEKTLKAEIETIDAQTTNIPTKAQLKQNASLIKATAKWINTGEPHFSKMSWNNKRKLLERLFDGKDAQGHRFGVYVKKDGKKRSYTIRGAFNPISGQLPMQEWQKEDLLESVNHKDIDGLNGNPNDITSFVNNCGGS